jgi:hypothetical protein
MGAHRLGTISFLTFSCLKKGLRFVVNEYVIPFDYIISQLEIVSG